MGRNMPTLSVKRLFLIMHNIINVFSTYIEQGSPNMSNAH